MYKLDHDTSPRLFLTCTSSPPDMQKIGQTFVEYIMAEDAIKDIPNSNGMRVMEKVPMLETGEARDIVIRDISEPFWQACIDTCETENKRYRVCAVGTPGIGKSTNTPFLIRMLLKKGKTVVYLVRTEKGKGWCYEFIPSKDLSMTPTCNVYPESMDPDGIPSLLSPETYYIVDPGKTKDNCDPATTFLPKVIIVASPDDRHWGESEFRKMRGSVGGVFLYYPLWKLEELLSARSSLMDRGPQLSETIIGERFLVVGGVPRHIFASEDTYLDALDAQDKAVNALSEDQALHMAKKEMDAVGTFAPDQPKSALIGYILDSTTKGFRRAEVVPISQTVVEEVWKKFMASLWNTMIQDGKDGWKGFEAYTRLLMLKQARNFKCRRCVGKEEEGYKGTEEKLLGGCNGIKLDIDIVDAAMKTCKTLFHSVNQYQKLIDFIYQDDKNHFHAFQATIGKTHTVAPQDIEELQMKVGGGDNLSLYYLVPGENFDGFVTNPVNPGIKYKGITCDIYHVMISQT